MYVIGLTGNIATGKSAVARMLTRLGACVIDADKVAHQVACSGTDVHRRIVARFGKGILGSRGEIDRKALGAIVFRDPTDLADLEKIVHPAVINKIRARLAQSDAPVGVVEAIKLLEAGMDRFCDAIWVVACPREQQIECLMRDRRLGRSEAELRIDAQPPQDEKIAVAHVVLENTTSLAALWAQVVDAWKGIPRAPACSADVVWEELAKAGEGDDESKVLL